MSTKEQQASTRSGVLNALAAYTMWGIAPMYFKLLEGIGAGEILMHRIIWSTLFLFLLVILMKKGRALMTLVSTPKTLFKLAVSAVFLAINWLVFIWAINNHHILDASLGYFINPLFNIALGMIFFSERLRKNQQLAVILAIAGVIIQLVTLGTLPFVSLTLASSFAIYGLLRKKMQVDSLVGLLVESILMLPFALFYWYAFVDSSTGNLFNNNLSLNFTLILAGLVTTAPLLCFTAAAKRLTLSSLGFFQYIGPSIMFILAIVYYQESLQLAQLTTFMFIWSALAIYSLDAFRVMRKSRQAQLVIASEKVE